MSMQVLHSESSQKRINAGVQYTLSGDESSKHLRFAIALCKRITDALSIVFS